MENGIMPDKVTDPQLLAQLNGNSGKVTDPEILRQLNPAPFFDIKKTIGNVIPDIKNIGSAGYNWGEGVKKAYHENESVTNPGGGVKAALGAAIQPITSIPGSIKQLVTHPITSFENAPISTLMAGYGAVEGGLGLANIAKKSMTSSIPEIVNKAGGEFKGIQKGTGNIPDTVMFNDPTGSTKMLAVDKVSPKNISKVLTNKIDYLGKPINQPTVQVSQQLAKFTGLSPEVQEAITTNPDLAKRAVANLPAHKAEIADTTVTQVNGLQKTFKKIGGDIYKKGGIDLDKTAVPAFDALSNSESEISKMNPTTPDNIRAIKDVKKTINNAIGQMDDKGNLTFGQTVELSKEMYDQAKSAEKAGDVFKSNYYKILGDNLTKAKYQIPEIAEAAPQYKELMQANDSLNKVFRLNSERGKMMLDTKIANMWDDTKNMARMQELHNIYKTFDAFSKDYPELHDIKTNIQTLQLIRDMEMGKGAGIPGLSSIPGVGKYLKLTAQQTAPIYGRMARRGLITADTALGRVPESQALGISRPVTTMRAFNSAFLSKPISQYMQAIFSKGAK